MKYKDVSEKSTLDLVKKKKEITNEIFVNRMKNSLGQLSNPLQLRYSRKDIARILTALSARKQK